MIFNGVSGGSGGAEIVTGIYTGTGVSQTQTITLVFRPKAVLVAGKNTSGNYYNPQPMNLAVHGTDAPNVSITDTGFKVTNYSNCTSKDDSAANPYRYIAFK